MNNQKKSNETSSELENQSADDYNKYIGKWVDENNSSELSVLTIGNNQLAFSWGIYGATKCGTIKNMIKESHL